MPDQLILDEDRPATEQPPYGDCLLLYNQYPLEFYDFPIFDTVPPVSVVLLYIPHISRKYLPVHRHPQVNSVCLHQLVPKYHMIIPVALINKLMWNPTVITYYQIVIIIFELPFYHQL